MSISLNGQGIADIRPGGPPMGLAGVGFSRVQFPFLIDLEALSEPQAYLTALTAEVAASFPGDTVQLLGEARPQNSWSTPTISHHRSETVVLQVDLTGEQLEALERRRGGGSLDFRFNFSLQIHRTGKICPASEVVWVNVNESDWARVLRQLRYLDLLIVAVSLPIDVPEQFSNAVKHVRTAYEDLIGARYGATVGNCRMAMDSLLPLTDATTTDGIRQAFAGNREIREAMTTGQRAELVRLAVRHFAHPAHHVGANGAPEVFSRHDALFILTAAAGVIWEAIARANALPTTVPSPPV